MSPLRIVPAQVAHSVSSAQPCGERYRFPGDGRSAVCRLTLGDHELTDWHTDTTDTRRWHQVNSREVEVMVKPGTPRLGAEDGNG